MEDKKYKYYKEHGIIYDSITDKDICTVYEHQGEEDLKLVMDSLEYFPKAVELLNESKSFKRIVDYEKWIKKVEEFLKSLENNE